MSSLRSSLVVSTVTALSLGCAKPSEDPVPTTPAHGHAHGGGGHGHGDANEHGYKGHRFDDPAKWTAEFESAERSAWQQPDAVIASLGLADDTTIADLGAGTGYFAVRFAAAVPQGKVYAVDIEPNMVAWLAERGQTEGLANLIAVQASADDPRLPDMIDVAFMCNVFHHLNDPQAYFTAVASKLAPDGRVVIVDFRKDNPEHAPGPPAQMRMSPEQIIEIMASAGYQVHRQDLELLEHQYLLEFVRTHPQTQ